MWILGDKSSKIVYLCVKNKTTDKYDVNVSSSFHINIYDHSLPVLCMLLIKYDIK